MGFKIYVWCKARRSKIRKTAARFRRNVKVLNFIILFSQTSYLYSTILLNLILKKYSYDLMLHCWATGRSLRPTFSIVADEFQNLKNSYSFDHRYLHELMEQDEPSTLQSMIEDFHRERKRTQSRSSRYTSRMESPFYSKMLLDKATDDPTTDLWSGNFNFSR